MAITPPSTRLWWSEPVARTELVWIVIAFLWGLVMFFMMIYWHAAGEQNLSNEAYRISAARFTDKTNAMVESHQVREESGFPVVRPPPGSDVYMIARLWQWWPILELEKDRATGCTSPRSTGSTVSRSSPPTSTCRCTPATSW